MYEAGQIEADPRRVGVLSRVSLMSTGTAKVGAKTGHFTNYLPTLVRSAPSMNAKQQQMMDALEAELVMKYDAQKSATTSVKRQQRYSGILRRAREPAVFPRSHTLRLLL